MNVSNLRFIFKNRFYPGVLQWVSVVFFIPVIFWLLFGPGDKRNVANLLIWLLWWPALCLSFLFFGRVWCTICPFSKISDLVQRFFGAGIPLPAFLKNNGYWIILIFFLELTWFEEVYGISADPRATAIMLLAIMTAAVGMGLFLQRRSWCRYMCPLGALASVYSKVGFFKLRPDEEKCLSCQTRDCIQGSDKAEPCPMYELPFTLESSSNCNLCGNCAKNCPHDAIIPRVEFVSKELFSGQSMRTELLLMVTSLAGLITLLNALENKGLGLEKMIENSAAPIPVFTFFFTISLFLSWALFFIFSKISAGLTEKEAEKYIRTLLSPMIPMLLLAHLGHTSVELLEKGYQLIEESFGLFGLQPSAGLLQVFSMETVSEAANPALLVLGTLFSVFVLYRQGRQIPIKHSSRIVSTMMVYYLIIGGTNFFLTLQ